MIERALSVTILESLARMPCVALIGPRQVGKTTLALEIAEQVPAVYLDLEDNLDLAKVSDFKAFWQANSNVLIILDEVQRLPEIFLTMRGIIDQSRRQGRKNGQFLILGSASRDLLQQSGETLAGRITYLELFPVDLLEYADRDPQNLTTLWLRGGFPESLLASSDVNSFLWRKDFIKTYLERDIPQLGARIAAETMERFWTMLAHRQGTLLNASQIARSLEVSSVTVNRYLDLMVDLLLVRRVKAWSSNLGKRLVRAPKVYIRDSGVTHALLRISDYNTLLGHPIAGESWECFVIENILAVASTEVTPYFYSTPGGAEIDLILEFSGSERWAIEIKRNTTPVISKGFYLACDDVGVTRKYVVYAGQDQFPMGNHVTAIGLYDMMHVVGSYVM